MNSMFKRVTVNKISTPVLVERIFKKIKEFDCKPFEKNDIFNLYRVCGHKIRVYHTNQTFVEIVDDEKWEPILIGKRKLKESGYFINQYGGVRSKKNPLFWISDTFGYGKISITFKGKQKWFRSHQLVAKAFIPNSNPKVKYQVNHIDSNIRNNYVYNLEWTTASDNLKHHFSKFRKRPGRHLSDEEFIEIRTLWRSPRKYTYHILAKLFKVSPGFISLIVNDHVKPELQPK